MEEKLARKILTPHRKRRRGSLRDPLNHFLLLIRRFFQLFSRRKKKSALILGGALVASILVFSRFDTFAATLTFTVPDTVDWNNAGATLSNVTKSGTDLQLSNTTTQTSDTTWASNNYASADYAINPTTETKLKQEVAQNFTSGSGLNTGSNDIRDVFDNGTYLFIATAGGLDVITKSTNTSKGYITLASGFTAVYADATNVYAGDGDGGVFKYAISNISGNTLVGSATYLSSTSPAIVNNNVNDLWGSVILNSTYLAVATAGGVTVINETAGTSKNSSETSSYSLVRITTDNELYYYSSMAAKLQRKDGVASLGAGFSETVNYTTATTPAILSNTINTIEATVNTSTAQAASNTVFVGTASGLSILQEHSTQASGTVRHYVNEATAGTSGYASTGFKSALKLDGTDDYVKVSDDDDMDFTSNFTVDMYVKFPSAFSADSQAKDAPLLSKGEQFQAYFDHQTGKLNFEFGDQGPLGAGASTASTVGLYAPQTGTIDHVNGMVEFNDVLYIGVGTSQGDGSVLAFDGNDWTTVLTTGTQYVDELIIFNSRLYAGTGGSTTDGYIYVCDPGDSGVTTFCDTSDWTLSLSTLQNNVTDLAQDGTYLYASVEDEAALWYCYPQSSGDTNVCESADWRNYFRYEASNGMENIEVFNSRVYASAGTTAPAGEGDIYDLGNIHISYDDTSGRYERFEGLATFNGYLYAGGGTGDGDGDLFICDPATIGGATKCDDFGDWTKVRDTSFDSFMHEGAAATFNSKLYVGTSGAAGDGQVWMCDPAGGGNTAKCDNAADWTLSVSPGAAYEIVSTLGVFNGYLYAGTGNNTGDGDIYYCDPAVTGGATTCETGDWAIAYDTSVAVTNFNYVTDFTTLNSRFYASFGGDAGEAELFYCTAGTGGNASICDQNGDWTAAYDAGLGYESARSVEVFNSRMYIGMGTGAGDADITICNPTTAGDISLCDNASDFTSSYANTSTQGTISSFAVYNSELYATTDGSANNSDLLKCTPGGDNECTGSDWVVYMDFDILTSVRGLTTFTSGADTFLYFATGGATTTSDADIWFVNSSDIRAWDGTNTTPVNTSGYEEVRVLFAAGAGLYAGFGDTTTGDGDLMVCDPAASGTSTVCEDADWSSSFDHSGDDYVRDMETVNGKVYAGAGAGNYEGDVYECTPGPDNLCSSLEWSTVFDSDTNTPSWADLGTYQGNLVIGGGYQDGSASVMKMSNPVAYNGSNDQTWKSEKFNDRLYTGVEVNAGTGELLMCNPSGNGDADTCEHSDFSSVYTLSAAYNGVYAAQEFKGNLYGGLGDGSAEGDIAGCDVDASGSATECDSADFSLVYNSSIAEITSDFEVMNGYLYAAVRGTSGDGDVLVCNPATTGAADFCDSGDWSTTYNGAQENTYVVEEFNGRLYSGQGDGAGDGDLLMCNPAASGATDICDSGDWSTVWDQDTYETLSALANFRGRLYAGFGNNSGGDNDVYMCDPTVGGTTTACDNANEWSPVYAGTKSSVNDLYVFQDKLYMNDEDREQLFVCHAERAGNTEYCDDPSEWEEATGSSATYAEFNRLGAFQGELYVGQGTSGGDLRSVGNAVTLQSTTTSWNADQWYLVSMVFNGTAASLYIDGTRQATRTISALPDPSEQALYIGRANHNGEETYFNGTIDELLISDTAEHSGASFSVPGAEVSFPGSATKGLLLHFNDGSGTTATDSGTKSNNGTLTNGPVFRYHTLEGTIDSVSAVLPTSDGTRAWVATNGAGADDGSLTQLNSLNTANAVQGDSWRESSSTPNMVDNDMTAIYGAVASGNVADLVVGTAEGVTRFYPGVAPSGSLVSTIKDFGTTNSTWGNITFNSTANSQTITVKVRSSNNSDMSGATDWASCTGISSGTDMSTNSCVTDGHRYLQYRIDLSTTSPSQNPQVEDVTLAASLVYGTWTYDFDATTSVAWSELRFTTTEPSGTDVKFRFATSSDGSSYSSYSSYFTSSGSSLTSLTSSRYLRIQAYLETATNGNNPVIDTFSIDYSKNIAPVISNLAVAAQTDGTAKMTYSASDADAGAGSLNITTTLEYTINNGTTWLSPTTTSGDVGTVSVTATPVTKTIYWTLSSNFTNSFLDDTVKVRVTLNDGEALNNTATATSSAFDVDTKSPIVGSPAITVNSAASTTNSQTVTLTLSATDDTSLQMTFSNDGTTFGTVTNSSGTVTNSGEWETYSSAKAWTLSSGAQGTRTVYVKFRDTYGNTPSTQSDAITLDTTSNDIVTSVSVADASDAGISRYQLALTWTPVSSGSNSDFNGYVVQRSTNASTYSDRATLNTVTDSGFLDTALASGTTYYYRVVTKDTAGNQSSPSSVVFGSPGAEDTSGPDLSGRAPVAAATEITASVAWTTAESATSCVEFGTATSYGTIVCELDYVLSHDVALQNLTAQTTYHYRVRSSDAAGNESVGSDYTFVTSNSSADVTAPTVTGDGPIVIPTAISATITWVTNEEADSFVEFGDSESMGTIQGDPTRVTNHSITVVGLAPLKVYYFRVRSTDSAGNLSLGTTQSFLTTAPLGSDVPPTISDIGTQTGGVAANSVIISWKTDNPSTSQVQYGLTRSKLDKETNEDPLLNLSHFVTIENLESGTTYYYQVRSVDSYGNETLSNVQNFTTTREAEGEAEISDLAVTNQTLDSAIVSWSTNLLSSSGLQYGTTTAYGTVVNDESTNFTTQHVVLLEKLEAGTTYHVQVTGETEDNTMIRSDDYTFTTQTLPVVSSITVKDIGYDHATVTWRTNVAADSNVAFGEDAQYGSNQGKTDLATTHEVLLQNLKPKTLYHFQVRSRDEFGSVAQSGDQTLITIEDRVAPKISELKSEVSQGANSKMQAIISWRTDELSTSQIEYTDGALRGGKYNLSTPFDASLNSTHTVIMTDLKPNATYHFRVLSKDATNNLAASDDRTFLTPQASESVLEEVVGSLEQTFSWIGAFREALGW